MSNNNNNNTKNCVEREKTTQKMCVFCSDNVLGEYHSFIDNNKYSDELRKVLSEVNDSNKSSLMNDFC